MRSAARHLSVRGLRAALILFFMALAVPAFLLVWQAYHQAQWEVFHRYRLQAEELAVRVNAGLSGLIAAEDARAFTDYSFHGADAGHGDTRSPLSAWPVQAALPGLLGYFQVDSSGHLTTPLLPAANSRHELEGDEFAARLALAERLRGILSGHAGVVTGRRLAQQAAGAALSEVAADTAQAERAPPAAPPASRGSGNVFERLTSRSKADNATQLDSTYGNVADLRLDQRLEQKSRQQASERAFAELVGGVAKRAPRREQSAIVETQQASVAMAPAATERDDSAGAVAEHRTITEIRDIATGVTALPADALSPNALSPVTRPRVRLFESELDPLQFEILDSDHFVLFRNVWRDGARFVQGAVIERAAFVEGLFMRTWSNSAVAAMSSLLVAWQGEVLGLSDGSRGGRPVNAGALRGELLYRTRLSAPFSALELVFSVKELPLGASTRYLAWVTLALLLVLGGGCFTIYRFARGQMRLHRQQQDFVSAVSHELKTPLTSIRMYSEMLAAGWTDEARRATYYRYIHDESERLSRLIENVLQLARVTRGQLHLPLLTTEVGVLLERCEARLNTQIAAAGFELERHIDDDCLHCRVAVDEDAIVQILINLVDNAIKFTPADGERRVRLACRRERDGGVRITVRDFGIGVAKPHMRRIFELFYRAGNELTRETVGTGIGLALVRELADALQAEVDVTNCTPGAEFSLVLPPCAPGKDGTRGRG